MKRPHRLLLAISVTAIGLHALLLWAFSLAPATKLLISSTVWMAAWAASWGVGLKTSVQLARAEKDVAYLRAIARRGRRHAWTPKHWAA